MPLLSKGHSRKSLTPSRAMLQYGCQGGWHGIEKAFPCKWERLLKLLSFVHGDVVFTGFNGHVGWADDLAVVGKLFHSVG